MRRTPLGLLPILPPLLTPVVGVALYFHFPVATAEGRAQLVHWTLLYLAVAAVVAAAWSRSARRAA